MCGNVVEVVVIRLNHGRDFVAFWSWTGRIVGAGLSVEGCASWGVGATMWVGNRQDPPRVVSGEYSLWRLAILDARYPGL